MSNTKMIDEGDEIKSIGKSSESIESDVNKFINPEQKLINDYKTSAQVINDLLKKIGLPLESFSREFQDKLNCIGELAAILNVKDPSKTSLLFGIHSLQNSKMKLAEQENFQVHIMSKLTKRINMVTKLNQELQKNMEEKEKTIQKMELQQAKLVNGTQYLEHKCDNYTVEENELQNTLRDNGAVPELYHGELVKSSEELKRLKEELSILTSKLESYDSLPPDEKLAQQKLDDAHTELSKLEADFELCSKHHFGERKSPDTYM